MPYIYDDEDNVAMNEQLGIRYPLITWQEFLKRQEEQNEKNEYLSSYGNEAEVKK